MPSLSWPRSQPFRSKNSRVCRGGSSWGVGGLQFKFLSFIPGTKNNQVKLGKARPCTWPTACPCNRHCRSHFSSHRKRRQGSEPESSPVLTLQSCHSQDPSLPPRNPHPTPLPPTHTQLNISGLLMRSTTLCSWQSSFHISFDLCHKSEGKGIHDYYYAQVKTEAQKGQVTLSGSHIQERSEGESEA